MIRKACVTALAAILLPVAARSAGPPGAAAAGKPPQATTGAASPGFWLRRAEAEAEKVPESAADPRTGRTYIRSALVAAWLEAGDFAAAQAVYDKLDRQTQQLQAAPMAAYLAAEKQQYAEAAAMLRKVPDAYMQYVFRQLAVDAVSKGLAVAMGFADQLQGAARESFLVNVAIAAATQGKFIEARAVAAKIADAKRQLRIEEIALLGEVVFQKKPYDQALKAARSEERIFINNIVVFSWQEVPDLDPDRAKRLVSRLADPVQRLSCWLGIIDNLVESGRKDKASGILSLAVQETQRVRPQALPQGALMSLATAMVSTGDLNAGISTFRKALEGNHETARAANTNWFVRSLIDAGQYEIALKLITEVPESARTQFPFSWARHHVAGGKTDKVRELLKTLTKPDQRAMLYIGVARGLCDRRKKAAGKE